MDEEKDRKLTIAKAKISKLKFPEICPVCLDKPEDLVSVTIIETRTVDKGRKTSASSWRDGQDKTGTMIASAQGASVFWVPTCMSHGSGKLRSTKTKLISALGFFLLFYPILYYTLGLVSALNYDRQIAIPFFGLLLTSGALIFLLLYGLYPRALERKMRFIDSDRTRDEVFIDIKNDTYREAFMELNALSAELVDKTEMKRALDGD